MISKIVDKLYDTNIYFIYNENSRKAIIIDPSNFDLVDNYIKSNNLYIDNIILTHEHFDHILGVNLLVDKYKCSLIASKSCNFGIMNSRTNLSSFSEILFYFKESNTNNAIKPYLCKSADIIFENSSLLDWDGHKIYMFETPGHSIGSISIILDDKYIFTGDSLLKNIDTITRFPGGSTKDYKSITIPFYKSLSSDMIVYPGHGESFILKEKILVEENK